MSKVLEIPQTALVVLLGASGSGKSSFAARHFRSTEIVSSDFCRGLVSDDENDQAVSGPAFELLHTIVAQRLALQRLSVVDATNVLADSRRPLLALARKYYTMVVGIVLDTPDAICLERNQNRPDRSFGAHVVRRQWSELRRSLRDLRQEGFHRIYFVKPEDEVTVVRQRLWNDRRELTGPFDIIGDVHGCLEELDELLERLQSTEERTLIFLGDLVDRGPDSAGVLRRVMDLVRQGKALCLPGNHDVKLLKKLQGKNVQLSHGLAETWAQLESAEPEFRAEVGEFLDSLVGHLVLNQGELVVAHAGLKEEMQGRAAARVREFCLYGETTGETDEFGLPVRFHWASEYRGRALVVYGHTPVERPQWLNKTVCIDTGCAFGGELTALRYPELETVSVAARRQYVEPVRPLQNPQGRPGDVLELQDFLGRRSLHPRYGRPVIVREENGLAALEALSRFGTDPRWLIYLPPTMAAPETSQREGFLEHPADVLEEFRRWGIERVYCQEKHMGSRAVVVLCRDPEAARRNFWGAPGQGAIYTRTGRPFFDDLAWQEQILQRLHAALETAGLWDELKTDWLCLDGELLPWSAKAEGMLRRQYAAVGSAALGCLESSVTELAGVDSPLLEDYRRQLDEARRYVQAWTGYCWPVQQVGDLRFAGFHVLAGQGRTFVEREHDWHLAFFRKLAERDAMFRPTEYRCVELSGSDEALVEWWLESTGRGGEGMVVKPPRLLSRGAQGWVQPAVKCRGREYLRIIYGPHYTEPGQLARLRRRATAGKRRLAFREFVLGLEALERFVGHESLSRVHECIFGVLALESEPIDPRL